MNRVLGPDRRRVGCICAGRGRTQRNSEPYGDLLYRRHRDVTLEVGSTKVCLTAAFVSDVDSLSSSFQLHINNHYHS
jgi:hypothetical protein